MSDIIYENKPVRRIKTGIIFLLAVTFTTVSLAMITEASWERSGSLSEAIIMSFLSGGVALSAHLLPALTKRRMGKFGFGIMSIIWVVALLATLYNHTIFFISNSSSAGNLRATQSAQVKDIAVQSEETKKLMQNTDARSVVAISRDIANVDIQINQLTPRACTNCKRIKANIAGLQAKKEALNIEMEESKRVAALRDKAIVMDEKAVEAKENARLDPIVQKLMGSVQGLNADAVTLLYNLLFAALLEMLATLWWWVLWADYKVVEGKAVKKPETLKNNKRKRDSDAIALESKQEVEKLEFSEPEKPLAIEDKHISLKASIHQIIYKDKLIDKVNEDIFIDPYVKGVFPIYKEQDNRKVKPRFLEEDINVVSFVRNITPVVNERAEDKANKAINLSDFDSVNVPTASSFDALFNNDNHEDFYNKDSLSEEDESNTAVLKSSEAPKYDSELFAQPQTEVMDTPIEIEPSIAEEHNQVYAELESNVVAEESVINDEEEQQAQEVILDESEEVAEQEETTVIEPSASLMDEQEDIQEEKKTANSDVVYTPRIRRPSYKNPVEINTEVSPAKESSALLSTVEKTKAQEGSEEEIKDVYRIERHVPKFEDKMEMDVKKVAAQFAKKTVDVPDSPMVFDVPVLVDTYEEKQQQQQNTQYVNPRKKPTTDINMDNVDQVLADLFAENK